MYDNHRKPATGKRTTRWAPLAVCLAVLALASVACGGATQTAREDATITVEEIVNRVEVDALQADTTHPAFVEVKLGQYLHSGNLVKTHADSEARIDISVDDFTRISRTVPKTIWRMGSFAVDGGVIVELEEGQILVFDEDNGDEHWPLHVVTPAGTASARGTWMGVGFNPETGVAEVQCFRGLCELENEHGYQVLTDEKTTSATATSPPLRSVAMTEDQVQRFWEIPEAKSEEITVPIRISAIEARAREMEAEAAHFNRKNARASEQAALADPSGRTGGDERPKNDMPVAVGNERLNSQSNTGAARARASLEPEKGRSEDADATSSGLDSSRSSKDAAALIASRDSNETGGSQSTDSQGPASNSTAYALANATHGNGDSSASGEHTNGNSFDSPTGGHSGVNGGDPASGGAMYTQGASDNVALVNGQDELASDPVDENGGVALSLDPEILSQQIRIVLTRLGWDQNEVANFLAGTETTPHREIENHLARLVKEADESG